MAEILPFIRDAARRPAETARSDLSCFPYALGAWEGAALWPAPARWELDRDVRFEARRPRPMVRLVAG